MTYGEPTDEEVRNRIEDAVAGHSTTFLVEGLVLVALGLLAIAMPTFSTLAVESIVGWLFLVGGLLRIVGLFRPPRMPGYGWSMAAGLVAAVLGVVLIAAPLEGVLSLTIVLIALFLVEGVAAIFVSLAHRGHVRQWGWLLLSGVVDLLLVVLILAGWPGAAAWTIGLLTGLNLFFLGLSFTMLALAVRGATSKA